MAELLVLGAGLGQRFILDKIGIRKIKETA